MHQCDDRLPVLFYGSAVAEWVRALAWTGDLVVLAGFESRCGNVASAIPFTPLCQCLSEETLKAVGPFYLVFTPGEVNYPTSPHWKCVTVVESTTTTHSKLPHGTPLGHCRRALPVITQENPRRMHAYCPLLKVKVWFYIALYPVRWTAQSALHFPPLADLFIPTPFSASLGSILAMQQLRNDYSLTFPPLSIARYSFIQLSRLRRREVKENAQTSKR